MDERLQRIYQLLGDVLDRDAGTGDTSADRWYEPPMPPLEIGSTLSATDLLSWWFRPPSRGHDAWDGYFGEPRAVVRPDEPDERTAHQPSSPQGAGARELAAGAALQALFAVPDDVLATDDAEQAVQVLYAFLHALGEGDVERCLACVADEYHTMEDDREIDRGRLRGQLEALLDSLHGWDYELRLSSVPQPVLHPYGILVYVEVSIDATRPTDDARRGLIERRVVFLERQGEFGWKIGALSRPRL